MLFYVFKKLHKIRDDQGEDGTNPSSCNGEKEEEERGWLAPKT